MRPGHHGHSPITQAVPHITRVTHRCPQRWLRNWPGRFVHGIWEEVEASWLDPGECLARSTRPLALAALTMCDRAEHFL